MSSCQTDVKQIVHRCKTLLMLETQRKLTLLQNKIRTCWPEQRNICNQSLRLQKKRETIITVSSWKVKSRFAQRMAQKAMHKLLRHHMLELFNPKNVIQSRDCYEALTLATLNQSRMPQVVPMPTFSHFSRSIRPVSRMEKNPENLSPISLYISSTISNVLVPCSVYMK